MVTEPFDKALLPPFPGGPGGNSQPSSSGIQDPSNADLMNKLNDMMSAMALKSDKSDVHQVKTEMSKELQTTKTEMLKQTKLLIAEAVDPLKNEIGNINEMQINIDRIDENVTNLSEEMQTRMDDSEIRLSKLEKCFKASSEKLLT